MLVWCIRSRCCCGCVLFCSIILNWLPAAMQSIFFLPTREDRCSVLPFSVSRFKSPFPSFFKLKKRWFLSCTVAERRKIWIHNQFPDCATNHPSVSAGSPGIRKKCLAPHSYYYFSLIPKRKGFLTRLTCGIHSIDPLRTNKLSVVEPHLLMQS